MAPREAHGRYSRAVLEYDETTRTLWIRGALEFGAAEDFRKALLAHPAALTIGLDSPGGYVAEARQMANEILRRRLDTYARDMCASACIDLFAAGERRWAGRQTVFGFHRSGHECSPDTGMSKVDLVAANFLRERGVADDFVQRAFETPYTSIWTPDPNRPGRRPRDWIALADPAAIYRISALGRSPTCTSACAPSPGMASGSTRARPICSAGAKRMGAGSLSEPRVEFERVRSTAIVTKPMSGWSTLMSRLLSAGSTADGTQIASSLRASSQSLPNACVAAMSCLQLDGSGAAVPIALGNDNAKSAWLRGANPFAWTRFSSCASARLDGA